MAIATDTISVETIAEERLLICRYPEHVTAGLISKLIDGFETGRLPVEFNVLHDFSAVKDFDLPDAALTDLGERRRATLVDRAGADVRAAVFGFRLEHLDTLRIWQALFFGEQSAYHMQWFDTAEEAAAWLGVPWPARS